MTFLTPDQFAAANKANLETLFGLTNKAFEGVEKLVELNLQVAKATLAETAEKLKAVNAPTPVVKKAAAKPRAKPAAETAPVAPKPRAPRKTVKKADEA